jgi:hypothetical protein
MTRLTIIKLVLLLVGLLVFAYGVRENLAEVRWAGIAFVAAALLLRLLPKKRQSD